METDVDQEQHNGRSRVRNATRHRIWWRAFQQSSVSGFGKSVRTGDRYRNDFLALPPSHEALLFLRRLDDAFLFDAKHVAQRLIETASEAYIIQGQEIRCTASVGISLMPKHGEELWHLLSVAELYWQAKGER